jgi:hypothetical protein
MAKRPLPLRELLKRLKDYDIRLMTSDRGKGSEIILVKAVGSDPRKGPQYPIKNHGPNTEIKVPVILALLRRFDIDPDKFWN